MTSPEDGMTESWSDLSESGRERRRHARFPLGLPVKVRLAGRADPLVVELMDLSATGARFQAQEDADAEAVHVDERVAFGFVVPDQPNCQARGQVLRVDRTGQFVLLLDHANEAFLGFIRLLAAES
jgi:PilZ domain